MPVTFPSPLISGHPKPFHITGTQGPEDEEDEEDEEG